jgi:serine/threonine protein kinase
LREAVLLASLGVDAEGCPHIVRYFSSWYEDGRFFIQTELCQGSLRDYLKELCGKHPIEARCSSGGIAEVLLHVAKGLEAMHRCGFVHLDVKPDNILRGYGVGRWKIADLGLAVAAMDTGCDEVCEGDCRYLAREVLRGDLSNLPKADIFSLGIMAYELATNPRPLACGGEEWHQLRDGLLDRAAMPDLPPSLLELLASLIRPVAAERPACADIIRHPCVASPSDEVRVLHEELAQVSSEAKKNRQMADQYWHELLSLKKRELLGAPVGDNLPGGSSTLRTRCTA